MKLFMITILIQSLKFLHASQDCGEFDAQFQIGFNDSNETLYQCPAESKVDIETLKKISKSYYELEYCLFKKAFKDGEPKVCQTKVKPVFGKMYDKQDGKVKRCGNGRNTFLHVFSYNYCGDQSVLQDLLKITSFRQLNKYMSHDEFEINVIYECEVCYDTHQNKTIWTTHQIHEYSLPLEDSSFMHDPECLKDISTDTFNLKTNRFEKIKELYEEEQKVNSNTNFIMKPQAMVPPQHFSNWTSKRSTNHYINMAPLSNTLVPLMMLIDEGIRKAAQKIFKKIGTRLRIYTAVEELPHTTFSTRIKNMFHMNEYLHENIGYKFVYNKLTSQGVLIYIHNTPKTKVEKKCSEQLEKACDFIGWSGDASLSSSISKDALQNAYCCQVSSRSLKEIFSLDFNVRYFLDIDYHFSSN